MKSFLTFTEDNGPNCGVKTAHVVKTHPETGKTVWSCENCGHTTPKTSRTTTKKVAMDKLFNDLTKSKT